MRIDGHRWDELRRRFADLEDRTQHDREQSIAELEVVDPSMAADLRRLLEADRSDAVSLDARSVAARLQEYALPPAGTVIAGYEIVGTIGRGGMAHVYDARQREPDRSVALKVIFHDESTEDGCRRFRSEAAALARLSHPHVARLYEVGEVDSRFGRLSFMAIEKVENAVDLIEHRIRNPDDSPTKLAALFAVIADAVHFGHQKGVIHRDLKPGNILLDSHGVPRLIDFGVARLFDDDVPRKQTVDGQLVGTVAYMSPEQVRGDSAAIDVRTDVYALGVCLFERLTGRLPIDLDGLTFAECVQRIENSAPNPSELRRIGCPRDLEQILVKALAREQSLRYASAADFARDLRRFVAAEPVEARRPSVLYVGGLFCRRHRRGLVVAMILAAVVVVATVMTIDSRRKLDAARQSDHRSLDLAANCQVLIADIFRAALPRSENDGPISAELMLERAERILTDRHPDPIVDAMLRNMLARVFHGMGRLNLAEEQFNRARRSIRSVRPPSHPLAVEIDGEFAAFLADCDRIAEARELAIDVLRRSTTLYGPSDERTLRVVVYLMSFAVSRRDTAEVGMFLEMLTSASTDSPIMPDNRLFFLTSLLRAHRIRKEYPQALEICRQIDALPLEQRTFTTAAARVDYGIDRAETTWRAGFPLLAEPAARAALADARSTLGESHPFSLTALSVLARICLAVGKKSDALDLAEESIAILEESHQGQRTTTVFESLDAAAWIYSENDMSAEATGLYRRALEIAREIFGEDDDRTAWAQSCLGTQQSRFGMVAEAIPNLAAAYEKLSQRHGGSDRLALATLYNLALSYEHQRRTDDALRAAERWLRDAPDDGAAQGPARRRMRLVEDRARAAEGSSGEIDE